MARQFIFKENDMKKAHYNDVLFSHEEVYKLTGDELNHISVLRFKENDDIIVNNMNCKILKINKDDIFVYKVSDTESIGIPNTNVSVYPAFLKADKMDYLVQKLTELGAYDINPFFSSNTIVKLDEKDKSKRKEKLQKTVIEATKQCGRTDEVIVNEFISFKEMLNNLNRYTFVIFAYENEVKSLKETINEIKNIYKDIINIALIVGPEGGFTKEEVIKLKELKNVYTVSLGERILRAETASINLLSILNYEF